jgi:hypothetical protein
MLVVVVVWVAQGKGAASWWFTKGRVVVGAVLCFGLFLVRPWAVMVGWAVALGAEIWGLMSWIRGVALPVPAWTLVVAGVFLVGVPALFRSWLRAPREVERPAPDKQPDKPVRDYEAERAARHAQIESDPARYVPYGPELAAAVADLLVAGGVVADAHREYCGTGLCYSADHFIYDDVHDGIFQSLWSSPPELDKALATFPDREAFVAWLASQCDDSLSGRGTDDYLNQRITRARLEEALRTPSVPAGR